MATSKATSKISPAAGKIPAGTVLTMHRLARELQIPRTTLRRWRDAGLIRPDLVGLGEKPMELYDASRIRPLRKLIKNAIQ